MAKVLLLTYEKQPLPELHLSYPAQCYRFQSDEVQTPSYMPLKVTELSSAVRMVQEDKNWAMTTSLLYLPIQHQEVNDSDEDVLWIITRGGRNSIVENLESRGR